MIRTYTDSISIDIPSQNVDLLVEVDRQGNRTLKDILWHGISVMHAFPRAWIEKVEAEYNHCEIDDLDAWKSSSEYAKKLEGA